MMSLRLILFLPTPVIDSGCMCVQCSPQRFVSQSETERSIMMDALMPGSVQGQKDQQSGFITMCVSGNKLF